MTVGSLFSGIAGLDRGFERAGFDVRWMCETDEYARRVLQKHWPDVPVFGDVCDLRSPPPVDVIIGGFPCQDISLAGKGAGLDGDRSRLWWEMHRIISDLRPRYAVMENVAALVNRGLPAVLGALSEIGYDAEWTIVSAASVGAPHLRERVFIVAYRQLERLERHAGDEQDGNESGRERTRSDGSASESGICADVGNTEIIPFRTGLRTSEQKRIGRGRPRDPGGADNDVGNADGTSQDTHAPSGRPRNTTSQPDRKCGTTVADAESTDDRRLHARADEGQGAESGEGNRERGAIREHQSGLGLHPDGFPYWLGEHRWVAPPGPQYDWEPPRVATGIANRTDRLRALGNAVVPQVAEYVARCVRAHAERTGRWR